MYKIIARTYAKAVFDIAIEHKSIAQWKVILNIFSEISKIDIVKSLFHRFLESKKLSTIFISICEDYKNGSIFYFAKNLIFIMSKNNRLTLLPMVCMEFNNLYQKYINDISIEVISVRYLSVVQLKKITDILSIRLSKKIYAVNKIDKSILGGIVIRINDDLIDGSIRGNILRLHHILRS